MPKRITVVKQNYPSLPPDVSVLDVVEEYYTYVDEQGKPQRVFVGAVYCPRTVTHHDRELFDPSAPAAQRAIAKMQQEVKKIKRYDRDIKRRKRADP